MVGRVPALLEYSQASTAAKAKALQELLGGCSTAQLRRLVLQEPSLLTRSSADLSRKLAALQQLTGLSAEAALMVVKQRPALLTRDASQLARSWRALSVWKFAPAFKAQLVLEHPLLLRLSPREVHGR
jgi:hypothetical protein